MVDGDLADFILAGDFCEEAKEGIISEPDEEALDPLVTDANTADLLWNNKTDDFAPDFAPISESVRKKILALKGVDQDVIFRTPGLRPDVPELLSAQAKGSMITSEMEAFFQVCPCHTIGVTGSDQIQKWKDPVSRRQYIF